MSGWQRHMDLLIALNNALRIHGRDGVIDSGLRRVGDMPMLVVGNVVIEVKGPAFVVTRTDEFGDALSRTTQAADDVHAAAKHILTTS
ncbi:hypothetical protein FHX37_0608 [Haloactinospora alba]|uniref:Uncharacterized protein n=1 Tax=Haloactinospora alba TaxID=405555 RepID=A0A543NFW4_9ACTN|nr:hypothetical protein [Haloactinospora alba]TQN30726.1 hypothetical protein FHX37_0608 [Haloactinospora alba]